MALFKIYRGQEDTLPAQINPGWCYYCWDTNHFYIDSDAGRKCINDIPTNLSDFMTDAGHRTVSDDQINTWIQTTQTVEALGTAATKDVAESGNATDSQVVMGNDTRLSDARVASDVYPWAKAETKPSYNATEVGAVSTESNQGLTEAQKENARENIGALSSSLKGANNGLAELDGSGKVPSSQLPSYVDDVVEYANVQSFPATGETGKIYVDTSNDLTYRWSGTQYTEISKSLALGETSSTAFRGDHGKVAYDHAIAKGSAFTSDLYKIETNTDGHVTGAVKATKQDITDLGIPGSDTTYTLTQDAADGHILTFTPSNGNATTITIPDDDTTYENATQSSDGLMSAEDKTKLNSIASGAQVNTITGVKGDSESNYRTGNVNITKANIGLGNVENKSSATIRGELTSLNVTTALGYVPPQQDTTYTSLQEEEDGTDVSLVTTGEKYSWNNNIGLAGYSIDISGVTTLPLTIRDSRIKSTDRAIVMIPSNIDAQSDAWAVTPSDGSITISGTIEDTTDLFIYMMKPTASITI